MYLTINRFGHPIVCGQKRTNFKTMRLPKLVSLCHAYGGGGWYSGGRTGSVRDGWVRKAYAEAMSA